MSLHKNQIIPLSIESLSSDGSGVGHFEGQAVFVPASAPGDQLRVRIVKDRKSYAFGIIETLEEPSSQRIPVDCPVARPCGGCCYRHIAYAAELQAKEQAVTDAFARIGGFSLPILSILPSPEKDRYRNKVQFPLTVNRNGRILPGFFAGRTHSVVPCEDCLLQPQILNRIARAVCRLLEKYSVTVYDEKLHAGLVRHIFLRRGYHSKQIMLCLVVNGRTLPHAEEICAELCREFPSITTILLNSNQQKTNVILGRESIVLTGSGVIEDTLCGVPIRLGPLSFYQVNTAAAEQLYAVARQFAALQPADLLLDLYCGMGTIGLSMAADCRELIGVEIVEEAVQSARRNAADMGIENARFLCGDAGQASVRLAEEELRPDVIVLDPPRKGCDLDTLCSVVKMSPRRVVMVSCNPSTAARDARFLADNGYQLQKIQPVDLFPRTKHVECVSQFTKDPLK